MKEQERINEQQTVINEQQTVINGQMKNLIIQLLLSSYNTNDKSSISLEQIYEIEKSFSIKSDSYFEQENNDRLINLLGGLNFMMQAE